MGWATLRRSARHGALRPDDQARSRSAAGAARGRTITGEPPPITSQSTSRRTSRTHLTLSELARLAGMGGVTQFGQAFKATFGRAPISTSLPVVSSGARRLLADTDLSITAIAYAVGFSSPYQRRR